MESYDRALIGKLLAWSGDHFVYAYGETQVIKFSKLEYLMGEVGKRKALDDHRICSQFMGAYILPTTFVAIPNSVHMAKIQERIEGHAFGAEDAKDPELMRQLRDIIRIAREMETAHASPPIDLIGGHGIFFRKLSNIFVRDNRKLIIIDTTLIDSSISWMKPLMAFGRNFARRRQESALRIFEQIASHS